MARLIEVEERDINYIFGKPKPYSLDVYQRDYRWSDEKEYKIVTQLLIDIELRFENNIKFNKRNQSAELPNILKDVHVANIGSTTSQRIGTGTSKSASTVRSPRNESKRIPKKTLSQ